MSESQDLLTNIYLGQPVVKNYDGPGIWQSIIDELTKLTSRQYFPFGVPDHLVDNSNLSKSFIST